MAEKKLSKKALAKSFRNLVLWPFDLLLSGAYADLWLSVRHAPAGGGIV